MDHNFTETQLKASPPRKVLWKFVRFLKNPSKDKDKSTSDYKPVVLVVRGDRSAFHSLLKDMDPTGEVLPKDLIAGVVDGSKIIRTMLQMPKPEPYRSLPLQNIAYKILHKKLSAREKFKRPPVLDEAKVLRDAFEKMMEDKKLNMLSTLIKLSHLRKTKGVTERTIATSKEFVDVSDESEDEEDEA